MQIILKTELGIEAIVTSRTRELGVSCINKPRNFGGLVLVENASSETIQSLKKIPEIKNILPITVECTSAISQIVQAGTTAAVQEIQKNESFAVRTTRRGKQDYSSLDINIALGVSICKTLGCDVNLDAPDKTVYVEIIGPKTYISVLQGKIEQRKDKAGTVGSKVAKKMSIIQLAYLDDSAASNSMGHRIGRAAQAFGIQELILAIHEKTVAVDLLRFADGVIKGRETRYKKQQKITDKTIGKARRVPVNVADLYQIIRERENEPIIITSVLGDPLHQCAEQIKTLFEQKRVNILIGSHKGVPAGISRFANIVVNLSPGLTYATEHGIPAAMVGIVSCVQEE